MVLSALEAGVFASSNWIKRSTAILVGEVFPLSVQGRCGGQAALSKRRPSPNRYARAFSQGWRACRCVRFEGGSRDAFGICSGEDL